MSSPVLSQLGVIAVATVVMCYPGALLAGLLGVRRALPVYLQPAAALMFTLTIVGAVLIPALYLQLSPQVVLVTLVVITLLLAITGMGRAQREQHRAPADAELARFPGLRWLYDCSPLSWIRELPVAMLVICAVTGAIAFILGGWLDDGDMMYHTAIARKLAELPGPTFQNIQLFVDGSLHPGYVAPAWHELVALTANLSGADVATVMWMIAVPAAILQSLTIGGLAFVLLRSHTAACIAAVVMLLSDSLARPPLFGAIPAAAAPSALTSHVLLPFALACWMLALWHPRGSVRRSGLVALLLGLMPALYLVHASYVAFLGIMIAGYLLVWLLRSPWPRDVVVRHIGASISLAVVTALGMLALAPALKILVTFDNADLALRSELAEYSAIIIGTVDSFHLRADVVVWFGGLALAGALCTLLAFRFIREPVAWLLIGATTLVLVISQYDPLFTAFSTIASTHQTKRIQYALPYVLSLSLAILFVGSWAAAAWERSRRATAVVIVGAAGGALAACAWAWPPLPSIKSAPVMPTWPIRVLLVVLLIGVLTLYMDMLLRLLRRRRQRRALAREEAGTAEEGSKPARPLYVLPQLNKPVIPASRAATIGAAAVLAIGSLPLLVPALGDLGHAAAKRPDSALRAYDLKRVDGPVISVLRRQPSGSVVMSPLRMGLRIEAVAPVYVVGVRLTHVARTRKNRPASRREAVERFYAGNTSEDDRFRALQHERAEYVVVPSSRRAVLDFMQANRTEFQLLAKGKRQSLYRYTNADVL